jgi:hypothetical protein
LTLSSQSFPRDARRPNIPEELKTGIPYSIAIRRTWHKYSVADYHESIDEKGEHP